MKGILLKLVVITSLFFTFSVFAAEEIYKLDPNHSYVLWHASHFGFSHQSGKFPVEGTLTLDEKNINKSKVNATIKIDELATGISEFDKHLKGKLFLNADQFATATFVSDKVTRTGKNTAKVQGLLTLHGVSKPIMLDVTFNKSGLNPINNKQTVGFAATTSLKRSEYDIKTLLPDIGDEIKIEIQVEGNKV